MVALAVVGSSRGGSSPSNPWTLTNLVRVARNRYHAYVGIQTIGLSDSGAVYWTAYRQYSDGTRLEVFRWRNGDTADLGSPGPGLVVTGVNDREQFVVDTALRPTPTGPLERVRTPKQPPERAYLWARRKLAALGSLGGDTVAVAINDRGQIVGSSAIRNGSNAPRHAFLWQNGTMTDLGTLGGRYSESMAINGEGQVIGTSATGSRHFHGFIWQHGKMADLGTLGGATTTPVAINDRGEVIGQSTTPRGTTNHFSGDAFLWQKGKMVELGAVDLRGYPGRPWRNEAMAINEQGDIVGVSKTTVGAGRAFLWRDGNLTDLGTLGGRSSAATAIDDRGDVVGQSDTRLVPWTAEQAPRPRPVFWSDGSKIELSVDYPSPSGATAITPDGTEILGRGGSPPHQALVWTRRS